MNPNICDQLLQVFSALPANTSSKFSAKKSAPLQRAG